MIEFGGKTSRARFEGRINRIEYLVRLVVCLILILPAFIPRLLHVVARRSSLSVSEELFPVPMIVITLMVVMGYMLPAMVRRLHDFGRSASWLVVFVVLDNILKPMFGKDAAFILKGVFDLLLLFWPGTKGPNEYGEVPRFEFRKLMGWRFAATLVVMYLLEAAFCGWVVAERRARKEAAKIPVPQVEVDGMLANMATANEIVDYERFNQRMEWHRLVLTNLTVGTVCGKGSGWQEVGCKTAEGVNVLLYVSAKVMDSLPGDFIHNDQIASVGGRVLTSLDGLAGAENSRPGYGNAIWLEADEIDVTWKVDLQPVGPSISGDELARLAACMSENDQRRKATRMRRQLIGRELEFSRCRVVGFRMDAKIPCVMMVAQDPENLRDGIRFSAPIDAEKAGQPELLGLHVGQELRAVRALVCEKGDKGETLENLTAGVWMRLLKFETDEPTVALPPFDESAITGDELVALLREHKNRLSPVLINALQRKLSGRRLTFSGMRLRSYGGANGEINSADFAFSDIGLQLSVELQPIAGKKFESLKHGVLTGMVAKEPANDSYGDRALRMSDGVVK